LHGVSDIDVGVNKKGGNSKKEKDSSSSDRHLIILPQTTAKSNSSYEAVGDSLFLFLVPLL
jgi:hypothetical protein